MRLPIPGDITIHPTVSKSTPPVVIMPCYNEAATLEGTLASVREQTLAPGRVLVAEGGSNDGTRDLLRAWRERLPLTILTNPERRQAPGLNRCLRHTDSPFVARLDGHSRWGPRYLERLVGHLRSRPDLAAAGARVSLDEGVSPFQTTVWRVMSHRLGTGGPDYRCREEPGSVPSLQSPVYRRSALEGAGGFREDVPWAEDDELHHRLRRRGWELYLDPTVRLYYRPRAKLRAFLRQSHNYGRGRASLAREGVFPDPRHRRIDRLLRIWTLGLAWNPLGWLLATMHGLFVVGLWGTRYLRGKPAGPWFPALLVLMHAFYWGGWLRDRFRWTAPEAKNDSGSDGA